MGLLSSIGNLFVGSKKKTKTKGTSEPWAPAIPALKDFLGDSESLYANTPQFSPQEQRGYAQLDQSVATGLPLLDRTHDELMKNVLGAYNSPDTNPYLADIAKRIGGEAGAGVNATFGGRGRSSGGLAGYYGGKGIGDAIGEVYSGAYESDRNRQLQAAGMVPSLQAARLVGPSAIIDAGTAQSARPFDINAQRGGILAQIGGLGQQTTGQTQAPRSGGILRTIGNSFMNKLFPGGGNAF